MTPIGFDSQKGMWGWPSAIFLACQSVRSSILQATRDLDDQLEKKKRKLSLITRAWRRDDRCQSRMSALFLLPLSQPDARAATVLVDELDAGGLERTADCKFVGGS